jgi:hypothetical protein
MTLGIIDLLIAAVPVILSIGGLWMKFNNVVVRQDLRIKQLEKEILEMRRHNEKTEEKIFDTLNDIKESVTDIKLHFSSCVNFKTNK